MQEWRHQKLTVRRISTKRTRLVSLFANYTHTAMRGSKWKRCECVCVREYVQACVRPCVRSYVRVSWISICEHAHVRACAHASVHVRMRARMRHAWICGAYEGVPDAHTLHA